MSGDLARIQQTLNSRDSRRELARSVEGSERSHSFNIPANGVGQFWVNVPFRVHFVNEPALSTSYVLSSDSPLYPDMYPSVACAVAHWQREPSAGAIEGVTVRGTVSGHPDQLGHINLTFIGQAVLPLGAYSLDPNAPI